MNHPEACKRLQRTGCLRRKPGRGQPSLSLSCSDKLMRWAVLGLESGLLKTLLLPQCRNIPTTSPAALPLSSIIIGPG
ncbi:unnamed protein product [Protopolystoma xenopodis]|uniref:tRNA-specific adenosine deaminase 1 n=1 Tax=Protopolystoma xenopodis TaxID=117903 RepID=A0A448XSE2_9PLAT|nr:unnamed protein product [Protopolystoma xenopodis]